MFHTKVYMSVKNSYPDFSHIFSNIIQFYKNLIFIAFMLWDNLIVNKNNSRYPGLSYPKLKGVMGRYKYLGDGWIIQKDEEVDV